MAKLSSWNLFVKKVYKENPGKTFGEALKIASTLKKQGKMNGVNVNSKSAKSVKNVKGKTKGKKSKTGKSKK
jgi:hypothetical protein